MWDSLAALQFEAVWLMGVWQRSPAGIAVANRNSVLRADFERALPGFTLADNAGSPYCIGQYVVDPHLGGNAGLAIARQQLAQRGLKLILDFVPNHVAPDHPWTAEHPDYFFHASEAELAADPDGYLRCGSRIFACGKDPNFPPWPDVVQLNITHADVRAAAIETLQTIAAQCDGVRCDMAVLMLTDVFHRTWASRIPNPVSTSYWPEIISAIRAAHPNFIFLAEAYWNREAELLTQGFDLCYDKAAYDYLAAGDASGFRSHILAPPAPREQLLRFLENHDEPRASAAFPPARLRACAVALATLPGAVLFHEGQLEGRRVRIPVFLQRRPVEPADASLQAFYSALLTAIADPIFSRGEWTPCPITGWPDNPTADHLVAWTWQLGSDIRLVVVNLSDSSAQARVHPAWNQPAVSMWSLRDVNTTVTFDRAADEIQTAGLYVSLEPWQFHFFDAQPF